MKLFLQTIFILIGTSLQAQIYVNINANGDNDGTSWENAYTTLHHALEVYEEGDEIWVATGTYLPQNPSTWTDDVKQTFYIHQEVKLYGGFAGTESTLSERDIDNNPTILSGDLNGDDIEDDFETNREDNAVNVIYVENTVTSESVLDGFTIMNGHADGDQTVVSDLRGGGIWSYGAIQLQHCTFQQNYAGLFGAGVYYRDNAIDGAIINDCVFQHNTSFRNGGGMHASAFDDATVSITVTNCLFSENKSESGAGLNLFQSGATVTNCTFTNNESQVRGGGIGLENYENNPNGYLFEVVIDSCIFDNNSAARGGGLGAWNSGMLLTNSTFINNQGISTDVIDDPLGGGIFIDLREPTENYVVQILNNEFINNSSSSLVGCIYMVDISTTVSNEISIDQCLFQDNSAAGVGAIGISKISNDVSISNSIFEGNSGGISQAIAGGYLGLIPEFKLEISNCLFNDHYSVSSINPIVSFNDFNANISNCTFADNEASGIAVESAGNVHLQNNILQINAGYSSISAFNANASDLFTSLGGNLFSDDGAADIALDFDLQNTNPLFAIGNFRLSMNSPCVDAGVLAEEEMAFDLAGDPRIQGSCIDIGAYESSFDADIECQMLTNTKEVLTKGAAITVYPNPVYESTTLLLENDWIDDLQIRMLNTLGQVQSIQTIKKTSEQFQLDLDTSHLVPGTYKVLISNGKEMAIASFTKFNP